MKTRIHGRTKLSKANTRQALNFFCRELMSKRLCDNLNIKVIFDKTCSCSGEIEIDTDLGYPVRNFVFYINPKRSIETQLSTLGHECVHVKQYATDQMKELLRGPYTARFQKRLYIEEDIAYHKRPWEIEAYALENKLYKKYQKFVRTKK